MKRRIMLLALVGVMSFSLMSCGSPEKNSDPVSSTNFSKETVVESQEVSSESNGTESESQEISSETKEDTDGMSQSEYMKSNSSSNIEDGYEIVDSIDIDAEKSSIKFEKFELTTGDSEQNAIILYFDFTNKSNDTTNIRADFDVTVFQNGVSCSPLMTTRDNESIENENKNIIKGGSVNVGLLYELNDIESPIKIRVENTSRGEVTEMFFQQQELNINQ